MLNRNYTQSERIELGLNYVKNTDFSQLQNGKYEILGGEVYAIVQDYNSKPISEGKFEAHRKFIDIQYIIKGEEQIGVGNIENFNEATEYSKEKDIIFLSPKTNCKPDFIQLKDSEFAIFKPCDAHMPSIAIQNSSYVRKVVVKVLA